ncbi:hypothetical protein WA588_005237, partial [Blastocystis sp. NMH]
MCDDSLVIALQRSLPYLSRADFIHCLCLNWNVREHLLSAESIFPIARYPPEHPEIHAKFWNSVCSIAIDVERRASSIEEEPIELGFEDLSDVIPNYHPQRLMKDEHIDGEIYRDVIRTFHNHQLFHYPANHGQAVLESVLQRVSDNFFSLGYCQGMNYVAGAIIVALVDPQLKCFCSNDPMVRSACSIHNPRAIIQQTYTILTKMIYRLHLIRLWGYGFPDLSLYTFILNQYLLLYCPSIPTYLESIGFDLSIVVARWFIPLFADIVPFFCLFRLWDYVMTVGFVGLFRIAVGLFALHGPEIMTCEIVSFSDLLNHIGTTFLAQESNVQTLFATMASLAEINEQTFAEYREQYEELHRVESPATDDADRLQLSRDISSILHRIRELQRAMAKQTEEICRFLEDKRQFTEKLVYYQEQKGALTARYDDLFESFNLTLDSERVLEIESEETATDAFRLRSVSRQLTALSLQVKECDMTLQQIERNIAEGLQNLDDMNTQRMSLRIQLSRLIKRRSMILERCGS